MVSVPLRRLVLTGALALVALAAAAGSAQADVTASSITSPANTEFFYDHNAASSTLFTVTGTATTTNSGTNAVDIVCYDGGVDRFTLATAVPVTNGAFSADIPTSAVDTAGLGGWTCVLRAVPTGDVTDYVPGSSNSFGGPTIGVTEKDAYTTGGQIHDYDYYLSDFGGYLDFESAGSCGLAYGQLYTTGTLALSSAGFVCLGALYDPDLKQSPANSNFGGGIKVDNVEALDSASAGDSLPGYQGIALSESFSNGALTIHDNEPILVCVPSYATCTSYQSSGVELDRTWQTGADGRVVTQTDVFRSVDGHAHALTALEDMQINYINPPGASFLFPGGSGWQDYATNALVSVPSGAGTVYFKTDSATPDAGDAINPQGSISYSSPPSGPVDFSWSDQLGTANPEFVFPYNRSVPAGGSTTIRFGYSEDYALSAVQSHAAAVLASFAPAVTISAPANGATVATPSVTVSGTVTDPAGIASVKVNGVTATVGAGGTFTAAVPLTLGANVITAVATDADGITGQKQVSVTYKGPPVVVTGAASHVTGSSAKIAGTVNPLGQATTYAVQYGKTTAYASHTAAVSAGAGSAAAAVSRTLTGLKAKTTYHYRVMATNASGTSYGADRSFHTGKPAPKGLGAKASPQHASSFPYAYTVKGKLSLPGGVSAKQACTGKITIKVKRGAKTIFTTHASIGKKCTWKASVTLSDKSKVPGKGTLKITPSFGGNKVLAGLTAKPLTVRYG
jgi:hypothetical protein